MKITIYNHSKISQGIPVIYFNLYCSVSNWTLVIGPSDILCPLILLSTQHKKRYPNMTSQPQNHTLIPDEGKINCEICVSFMHTNNNKFI